MDTYFLCIVPFFLLFVNAPAGETTICTHQVSTRTYYEGGWWRGKKSKTVYRTGRECCVGWYDLNDDCRKPLCNGKQYPRSSCVTTPGHPVYIDKTRTTLDSGGVCVKPNVCDNCKPGFYPSTSGQCLVCGKIQNCIFHVCTSPSNHRCVFCKNEWVSDQPGKNEFTQHPTRTACTRTCSWVDGYRCFPGYCSHTNLHYSSCICKEGFGGRNCATATSANGMTIPLQSLQFRSCTSSDHCDPSVKLETSKKVWTNVLKSTEIDLDVKAKYYFEKLDLPPYIPDAKIGLESIRTRIEAIRGTEVRQYEVFKTCDGYLHDCFSVLSKMPISGTGLTNIEHGYEHGDRILFTVFVKNGGEVIYTVQKDELSAENKTYRITGIEMDNVTYELEIDLQSPEHCFETSENCTLDAITTSRDFLREGRLDILWDGWSDINSGLKEFLTEIYPVTRGNSTLEMRHQIMKKSLTPYPGRSTTLNLDETGVYAVLLTAFDHAGNQKTARRLFMFDNTSHVTLYEPASNVSNANMNGWITQDQGYIEYKWPSRFANDHHEEQCWLCEVDPATDSVPNYLDDTFGRSERTREAIKNKVGIVRFDVAFNETYAGTSNFSDYQSIPEHYFDQERMRTSAILPHDGKRIVFYVRAYDVMGSYGEDNATVYIDKSPPIVENLWLTKGDTVNISVHNVTELEHLIIEWIAFDLHSGMHEISWKVFDNFTGQNIIHGQNYETPRGESQTLDECNMKYEQYARGPNCYCTPFHGCFHKHYQVQPRIDADNDTNNLDGIHELLAHGEHEREYFIEVKAVNKAGLTTTVHKKVTIDVSPPQDGHVHDGIQGQNEVDFQQSQTLSAHWNGFIDKESGVWFYMYGFATNCLTDIDLREDNPSHNVFKTYSSHATYNAPSKGQYFVTVVAYNHALDQSRAICSDGVIIDDTPVIVSEVVVKDAITTESLFKDVSSNVIYYVEKNRELSVVRQPTQICLDKVIEVQHTKISMYPIKRTTNDSLHNVANVVCEHTFTNNTDQLVYITTDGHLDLAWNVTVGPGDVYDFEVGISTQHSQVPDALPFRSTHHHAFTRLFHPGIWDGTQFFILIKSISKSSVSNVQIIGPFVVVKDPPEFEGRIRVEYMVSDEKKFIVASWETDAFTNHGDQLDLHYSVAIGTSPGDVDTIPFTAITPGASCNGSKPTVCTAIELSKYVHVLHDSHPYYISIKAENTVGLFAIGSSERYTLYSELASIGIVHDINSLENRTFLDIEDIDFQSDVTQISSRWNGFETAFAPIHYTVCLVDKVSKNDVCAYVGNRTQHTFTGLSLTPYKKYLNRVTATTNAGNMTATSDGITILIDGDVIDVDVKDGPGCSYNYSLDNEGNRHHLQNHVLSSCVDEWQFQRSTNNIYAHWIVPVDMQTYTQDVFWAVEERDPHFDHWTSYQDYQHIKSREFLHASNLFLEPGRRYRVALKLCAKQYCFAPVHSDGVTIIPNPPETQSMSVNYEEATNKVNVILEPFYDSDIEDEDEAKMIMHHYEWVFTDNGHGSRTLDKWTSANVSLTIAGELIFDIPTKGDIRFTKCWMLVVKGYTHVGLESSISREIRNCSNIDEIRPAVVIDALPNKIEAGDDVWLGGKIELEQNEDWFLPDIDYTPFTNVLSAVWATLRHGSYEWAVIRVTNEDPTTFYHATSNVTLKQPCTHPEAIACGQTDKNFINAPIPDNVLTHGTRCLICIHANATTLHHELWTQDLPEVSECSDGVTIDLTAPEPGEVWIGSNKNHFYQTSTSDLVVFWESFLDVEEESLAIHESGVTHYMVAIGTTPGGNDIADFVDVGITNHKTFHHLQLQSGHQYFATVKAFDFTGRYSYGVSKHVTVDATPPDVTDQVITLLNRHIVEESSVSACWTNVFYDDESGIDHFYWSIGSHAGYEDIMEYTYMTDECAQTSAEKTLGLTDGHAYFITVKAENSAGLFSTSTSWAFIVDTTPPAPGFVFDGYPKETLNRDADFLTSSNLYSVHWTAFADPHTAVKEYFLAIGTCSGCEDALPMQSVGIRFDTTLSLPLIDGIRYYTTVKACNTADLCSSATSDGFVVDKSPPTTGRVLDGLNGRDSQYQASRNYVGCKWSGFTDPQSGVQHYEWRVGTTKGGADLVEATSVHHLQEAFIADFKKTYGSLLPEKLTIFCTVRAYNGAGLFSESTSDGLIIDTTAPIFNVNLDLNPIGSIRQMTIITRSVIRVHWDIVDSESGIESQYISLSSHIGGEFNLFSTKLEGIANDFTFTGLQLHDGSFYNIKLVCCNGAKLCTESQLNSIMVDSSPPTLGAFAINTDHASVLNRQPGGWMEWNTIGLKLSWLGFDDMHSGISSYEINVGSSFMGDDLNKDSGRPNKIDHLKSEIVHSEGFVQTFSIPTKSLTLNSAVYVSVVAINGVGMNSPILHAKFMLLSDNVMTLVRRCDADTCLGHCICAPADLLCHVARTNCSITKDSASVEIRDVIDIRETSSTIPTGVLFTPFDSFLAATWTSSGKEPLWYECSVGETIYDSPSGVFDTFFKTWHECGQASKWIIALSRGKQLKWKHRYSFFLRAWYDSNTYKIYKSPGVIVLSKPPSTTNIRGVSVKEVVGRSNKDVDYVSPSSSLSVDWTGKFLGSYIRKFHVYLSTTPGGNDERILSTDIPSNKTAYNITGVNLSTNKKFYSVVQAIDEAGHHTTESSDGFIIDTNPPTVGVVNDGRGLFDKKYANATNQMSTVWYGFNDIGSGIESYEHCISTPRYKGRCDIIRPTDIGIRTYHDAVPEEELLHGQLYFNEVRAKDMAGHVSQFASSDGVIIDRTPPERVVYETKDNNLIANPSFEDYGTTDSSNCTYLNSAWIPVDDVTCFRRIEIENAPSGRHALVIQGGIYQTVNITEDGPYTIEFFTSNIHTENALFSTNEGFVDISGKQHIFLMHEKPSIGNHAWQRHFFKLQLARGLTRVRFLVHRANASFGLDQVVLKKLHWHSYTSNSSHDSHMKAFSVFTHDWSSIHAYWNFEDRESGISEYIWAVGTVRGGTQLTDYTRVGLLTSVYSNSLGLVHKSEVYVTVVAVNGAGLQTISYSSPVLIDLTPPIFQYLHDSENEGEDMDFQTSLTLFVHWSVADDESGIETCFLAIGISPYDTSLRDYTVVDGDVSSTTASLISAPADKVYVTVRCYNGAGLSTTMTSDGVRILNTTLNSDEAFIEVMARSKSQYKPMGNYHGDPSEVKFRWIGFKQDEGINNYLVSLVGQGLAVSEIVVAGTAGFNYAMFTGLRLTEGQYQLEVVAVNEIRMYSQKKTTTFHLLSSKPTLTGTIISTHWDAGQNAATANWQNVFNSNHTMYYEVTVSQDGGQGDLVQWQETTNTFINIDLDTDNIPAGGATLQFSVRAINHAGYFETAYNELFVIN